MATKYSQYGRYMNHQRAGAQIRIEEFTDSSVNIGMRYGVPTKQYLHTLYQANLAVYKALDQAGMTIPFPQRVSQ